MRKTKHEQEFEDKYEEYKKSVERASGGLVETNKADFIKFGAYFEVVIIPQLQEMEQKHRDTLFNLAKYR